MCKFLPKPTHTLHVMKLFESSSQFIVVFIYSGGNVATLLLWRESENAVSA